MRSYMLTGAILDCTSEIEATPDCVRESDKMVGDVLGYVSDSDSVRYPEIIPDVKVKQVLT
jgi:hypothetical protein